MVGGSKVVSTGTDLANTLMNVWANTDYQLAVFSYNGSGAFTNYNTTSPAFKRFYIIRFNDACWGIFNRFNGNNFF
ncbi:MAG: hypothetical protein IPG89_14300 [Bacteroidetes bacterium]|nr:hypothetical protein [Bacteroidota bacterium]